MINLGYKLEHKLTSNSDASDMVHAISLDGGLDGIALAVICCVVVVGDVVVAEIDGHVHFGLLDGFQLCVSEL